MRSPSLVRLLVAVALMPAVGSRQLPADEQGPRCFHAAWVERDANLEAAYEGLRLGLERARLARVCLEPEPTDDAARTAASIAWQEGVEKARAVGEAEPWLVAFGDVAARRLARELPHVPGLFVLLRYAVAGEALEADTVAGDARPRVVAQVEVAAVGEAVRAWVGGTRPSVLWHGSSSSPEQQARFLEVAGLAVATEGVRPTAVLHVRVGQTPRADWQAALRAAEHWRVPLISDDRATFGAGAALVLLPDCELVGRVAADLARRHIARDGEALPPAARIVRGLAQWVDLEAVDRLGLSVPLGVLAGADRLRRGRPAERRPE